MFPIGETRTNCDANEPQEDVQETRQIRRGRLNNETQREQRRGRRHQETTEQRQKTTSHLINCPPSPSFARFCESRISSILKKAAVRSNFQVQGKRRPRTTQFIPPYCPLQSCSPNYWNMVLSHLQTPETRLSQPLFSCIPQHFHHPSFTDWQRS